MKSRDDSNFYGFDHVRINEMFEGGLTYLNTFCVNGLYNPSAVYRCAKPNKEKGHQEYVLLFKDAHGRFLIRGMNQDQIDGWRYQWGIKCLDCQDLVYSIMRHDSHPCRCGNSFVDGGKDYQRVSGNCVPVRLDLLYSEEALDQSPDPE